MGNSLIISLNLLAGIVIAKETGLKFQTLYGTFLKWPQNNTLYSLLKNQFSSVEFRSKLMGGSIIVLSTK